MAHVTSSLHVNICTLLVASGMSTYVHYLGLVHVYISALLVGWVWTRVHMCTTCRLGDVMDHVTCSHKCTTCNLFTYVELVGCSVACGHMCTSDMIRVRDPSSCTYVDLGLGLLPVHVYLS